MTDTQKRMARLLAVNFTTPVLGPFGGLINVDPMDRVDQPMSKFVETPQGPTVVLPTCDEVATVCASVCQDQVDQLKANAFVKRAKHRVQDGAERMLDSVYEMLQERIADMVASNGQHTTACGCDIYVVAIEQLDAILAVLENRAPRTIEQIIPPVVQPESQGAMIYQLFGQNA